MTSLRQMTHQPTESALQRQIVAGLRLAGYTVLELGRWVRQVRCPDCGQWFTPRAGYGNTPGAPDLLATRGTWTFWIGLEIKTPAIRTVIGTAPAGRVRPEQRVLADAGHITIIHSLEEALAALEVRG